MTARMMTEQEVLDKKKSEEFDFEKLLEPYRQGGTEKTPVRRTMGTLIDWLVNKKKYPVEVAGGALLIVFTELYKWKAFKGDGTWGSAGNELAQYIRLACDNLLQKQMQDKVYAAIAGGRMAMINEFIQREVTLKTYPRWRKIFTRKKWKQLQEEYQMLIESAEGK